MPTTALILTLLIEGATLFLLREKEPLFYLYWAVATTLTNVAANLYLSLVSFESTLTFCIAVCAVELLVFISEGLLCLAYKKDLKASAKYSGACNLASFTIGSLILMIFQLLTQGG